jgi:hypothetical protein
MKKNCNGCKALCEVQYYFCHLGYQMERRSMKIKLPSGTDWWMSSYHPLEICTKPLTIKKYIELKGLKK